MSNTIRNMCTSYVAEGATPNWRNPSIAGVCYSASLLRDILRRIEVRYSYKDPAVLSFLNEKGVMSTDYTPDDHAAVFRCLTNFGKNGGTHGTSDHSTKEGLVKTMHELFDHGRNIQPWMWMHHRIIARDPDHTLFKKMSRCYKVTSTAGESESMDNSDIIGAMHQIARDGDHVLGLLTFDQVTQFGKVETMVDHAMTMGGMSVDGVYSADANTRYVYAVILESSHYTTVVIDLKKNTVEHFDSMGKDPSIFAQLIMKYMARGQSLKLMRNRRKLQQGATQCGAWALKFLDVRLRQKESWIAAAKVMNTLNDDAVSACRGDYIYCPSKEQRPSKSGSTRSSGHTVSESRSRTSTSSERTISDSRSSDRTESDHE